MNNFAVQAVGLTRNFGKFVAVDHIDLEVERGEIFGFLGANGAGKTTAIRMFCGLLKPSSGSATVSGFSVANQTEQIKKNIGYMSQKFSLYNDLTIWENLSFYGGIYGLKKNDVRDRGEEFLKKVNLFDRRNELIGSLPLGFKQRLALGVAVLHKPKVVFLDEPTGGVDPVARRKFWDLIYELAEDGTTVFVTTHYMDEAEYCNRISIMIKGKIAALDSPATLKRDWQAEDMQTVFLKVVAS